MQEQIILKDIKDLKKYKTQLAKIKIWVCNTACGKSYLCALDDRFYDLDSYRSQLERKGFQNFEDMTIPMMNDLLKQGKIILNAAHGHFLKYLDKNNIPFVYMYGKPEVEEEYIERMRHRGSSEEFINKFGTIIASHYQNRTNDKRGNFKIEMSKNEFVSTYAWEVFGTPKKYIEFANFDNAKFKIAFIDMDGTLINKKEVLSDYTIKVIKRLKNKIKIVLASGRERGNILPILNQLGLNTKNDLAISVNGGAIINGKGDIVIDNSLACKDVLAFCKNVDEDFLNKCCFSSIDCEVSVKDTEDIQDYIQKNKIYKIVYYKGKETKEEVLSRIKLPENIVAYETCPELIEFCNEHSSKGHAVKFILSKLGYERQEAIAIGNDEDDVKMFEHVACKIAVCNSSQAIKDYADYIADSNNDDGVSKALLKIVK